MNLYDTLIRYYFYPYGSEGLNVTFKVRRLWIRKAWGEAQIVQHWYLYSLWISLSLSIIQALTICRCKGRRVLLE